MKGSGYTQPTTLHIIVLPVTCQKGGGSSFSRGRVAEVAMSPRQKPDFNRISVKDADHIDA